MNITKSNVTDITNSVGKMLFNTQNESSSSVSTFETFRLKLSVLKIRIRVSLLESFARQRPQLIRHHAGVIIKESSALDTMLSTIEPASTEIIDLFIPQLELLETIIGKRAITSIRNYLELKIIRTVL